MEALERGVHALLRGVPFGPRPRQPEAQAFGRGDRLREPFLRLLGGGAEFEVACRTGGAARCGVPGQDVPVARDGGRGAPVLDHAAGVGEVRDHDDAVQQAVERGPERGRNGHDGQHGDGIVGILERRSGPRLRLRPARHGAGGDDERDLAGVLGLQELQCVDGSGDALHRHGVGQRTESRSHGLLEARSDLQQLGEGCGHAVEPGGQEGTGPVTLLQAPRAAPRAARTVHRVPAPRSVPPRRGSAARR
ncbi:hypothetical protein MN0502_19310 [Arthrobacter sp. MN05-02]|nr:hypothetical protein MN0502_19310 [Arthrobacter sp. MN05-02]